MTCLSPQQSPCLMTHMQRPSYITAQSATVWQPDTTQLVALRTCVKTAQHHNVHMGNSTWQNCTCKNCIVSTQGEYMCPPNSARRVISAWSNVPLTTQGAHHPRPTPVQLQTNMSEPQPSENCMHASHTSMLRVSVKHVAVWAFVVPTPRSIWSGDVKTSCVV